LNSGIGKDLPSFSNERKWTIIQSEGPDLEEEDDEEDLFGDNI
jgi:hypothetical protein